MLSERAKPIIQKLFSKAWLEQAAGDAPYGVSAYGNCSYVAGCAIGRFIGPELSSELGGTISSLLVCAAGGRFDRVREALLGGPEIPESRGASIDIGCLQEIQDAHDFTWREPNSKERYRARLREVARKYGLQVPEAVPA